MFPFWFEIVTSQRPSPMVPRSESPPTAPVLVTGSSLLIFPNDVCAETV